MRKSFGIIFFFVLSISSFGQDNEGDLTSVVKITLVNPGISYEARVGRLQTIYAQVFMSASTRVTETIEHGVVYDLYIDPALALQYRYYFNLKARENKKKRTKMNNLNYISPAYEVVFSELPVGNYDLPVERRPIHRLGLLWGMQRNYKRRFALDLNLGPGFLFTTTTYTDIDSQQFTRKESTFILMGQINLGFWLNKRKAK